MAAVTKIFMMETVLALLMCAMAADFARAKKSTGTPLSHSNTLMLPRLQLEIKADDNKVVLHVFNAHLIQDDPNQLTKAINCHVTGGHMEMWQDGKWKLLTTVNLHSMSKPLTWRSPEISNAILQTRTDIEVAYNEEGMLSCNDTVGLNLTSNSVLLRFPNTHSTVVSLLAPHSVVVYDLVEDFRYMSSHEMAARLLRTKTLDDGRIVVVARVSHYNTTEVEDDQLIEMAGKLSRKVARKRKATLMYVRSTCCCSRAEENGFHWPATSYGRTVVPLNPCVDDRGSPVPSQRCVGDFIHGVQWERQHLMRHGECGKTGYRAQRLQNMSDPAHTKTTMNGLLDVVKQGGLAANEITLVSRSLMAIAQNFTSAGVVVSSPPIDVAAKVVSTVLDSGRDTINEAEKASGSSKDILDTVDELVAAAAISGHQSDVTEQHISLLAVPKASGIIGVAALPKEGDPTRFQLVSIPCNNSLEDVLMMSPSSAALLLECPEAGTSFASTVFQDDSLFLTRDEGKRTATPVVGMTLLDGNKATLMPLETKVTLLLLFPKGNGTSGQCSFWDKQEQDWSSAGCAPTKLNVSKSEALGDFNVCVCTHLTHFAMLISTDPSELEGFWTDQRGPVVIPNDRSKPEENATLPSDANAYGTKNSNVDQLSTIQNESENISYIQNGRNESKPEEINRVVLEESSTSETEVEDEDSMKKRMDEDPLHKLSLIACSVSLVCLLCIFLVAAVSKNWRRGVGRKLQLHMSASLALLMAANITVQLFPGQIKEDGLNKGLCVSLGILLHYTLLTTFSWMLVVAVLQAIRLNPRSVLDSRNKSGNHLVLKASLFGWGIPLLPVITLLCSGSNVYALRRGTSLCYPQGIAFYASVVAPVGLVIVVNTCVFIFIFRNIFCNNRVGMRIHQGAKRRVYLRRISFGLFLFCLLGLNWAVGLLLQALNWNVTAYRIVAYIFCSTATLQGASLFVFFVACERNVSDKIADDIAKLKRRSYDVAARFRNYRKSVSITSDRIVSLPEST